MSRRYVVVAWMFCYREAYYFIMHNIKITDGFFSSNGDIVHEQQKKSSWKLFLDESLEYERKTNIFNQELGGCIN